MTDSPQPDRLHALDAVRGFALTLGVFFHATMSFLPGMQIWTVQDVSRSPVMGVLFFCLHIFRMSAFFMIAGFFARMMLERRGVKGFVIDRAKRIAAPLAIFYLPVMGLIIAATVWGVYLKLGGHLPSAPPPTTPTSGGIPFPLTHLWFLWVLILLYAGTLAVRALLLAVDRSGALRGFGDKVVAFLAGNPVGPLLLAAPFATASILAPQWLMFFGVPTPDQNLIPNLQAVIQFGLAFGFGWLLHRQMNLLSAWARRWPLYLGVAVVLTAGMAVYLGPTPVVTPAAHDWKTAAFAVAYGTATWSWIFAIIGLAMRFLSGHSAWRRYLADASYWIYIVHLPLVMALQAAVSMWPIPALVKYVLVLAVAFPIMLATYQGLVRYSWLGALLNGRRAELQPKADAVAPQGMKEAT